ncbi:MAG: YdbH domain-containing protein [Novosphingobium sp.]
MSEPEAELPEPEAENPPPPRRRRLRRGFAVLGVVLALALLIAWLARERIANSIIAGQLEDLGIPGTYEIESIGTSRQVLKNVVIGDPARPDATIAQAVVVFEPRFGIPVLSRVELQGARLFGTYRQGKLSFGRLDPVIFGDGSAGRSGLPDLDLVLDDARARIEGDLGVIGFKAEGRGNVRNSFAGTIAAVAPQLVVSGCNARGATLFGKVTSAAGSPRFSGPLRLEALNCPNQGLALRGATLQLDGQLSDTFSRASGGYGLTGAQLGWQGGSARAVTVRGDLTFADGDVVATYRLGGRSVDLGSAGAGSVAIEGTLRSRDDLARFDGEGKIRAGEVRTGTTLGPALAGLEKSGQGTLLADLARQFRLALAREERGSSLRANYTLRQTGGITQLTLPSAELSGGSGTRLVGVSRFALSLGMKGGPRFSGRFVTGGAGLPRIEGLAQRAGSGGMEARLSLAEYRAGSSSIALPDLRVVQLPGGQIGFAGRALVSGPLPGGDVRGLRVPIEGNWSERGGLAIWRRCTPVAFDTLTVGSLKVGGQGLTLCPGNGGAIARTGSDGLRIAAGTAGLDLAGTLGTTPIRLRSGAIGAAWPGALAARNLDIVLGPGDKPSMIRVAGFSGTMGQVFTGKFSGAEVKLFAVPLDISEAAGDLRFADSVLDLSQSSLKVTDRSQPGKFEPLIARDARLHLADNRITAEAMLREPGSDREIVLAALEHNLASASGHADLKVPGIVFDGQLQPDTLTYLAGGVVALAKGKVWGDGRIDWTADGVTSTGRFTTDGLDFAAAFGPVKGMKGTVEFADLLGLVTKPDQRLTIASINPGIEVFDGTLSFQIEPEYLMVVNGAEWPFVDGALKLLPTRIKLDKGETRRFTLKLEGANAAKFISQLELANISASGIFDGTLPLVFDEDGGRIVNGLLVSRPPGGNISYVGELTYKDLSAMGNFAFQTLRSLDYRRMEIGIDGELDGDIVTNMRIEGVRQGQGAKKNFFTRQLGRLPIRFNVNIKAPFYQLVTSFKSLYDPAYVRDPRSLGLIDEQGRPIERPASPGPANPPAPRPEALPALPGPAQKPGDIQAPDSRNKP